LDQRRKRDERLEDVAGVGVEVGVEAGFTALAEVPPVAAIVCVVAGIGLVGFLAWKGLSGLAAKKSAG
jgi:hypothetical protein